MGPNEFLVGLSTGKGHSVLVTRERDAQVATLGGGLIASQAAFGSGARGELVAGGDEGRGRLRKDI